MPKTPSQMISIVLSPDWADRLDVSPHLFVTPTGRQLAYDVRGAPDGRPVFWFHGSPSCRWEAILLDAFGREHGYRIIASDRPGIGGSAPAPGWSMLDYAGDVVALADELGFERFSVAGGSGGGPFVLAMAALVPTRLDCAISLACAGAFEIDSLRAQIGWVDRLAAWAVPKPGLLTAYFGLIAAGARTPPSVVALLAPLMSRWLPSSDPRLPTLFLRTLREATKNGYSGVVEDTKVLHRAWGFDVTSIRFPVDFVNGTRDEFVPFAYGAELADRIPGARLHTAQDATHFGTIFDLNRLQRLMALSGCHHESL